MDFGQKKEKSLIFGIEMKMKHDIFRKQLELFYDDLKKCDFPKWSKNERLSNWIEELMEIDAYYAGLALSIAKWHNAVDVSEHDIIKLRQSLEVIQINTKKYLKIKNQCYEYIKKIEDIHRVLKQIRDS